MPGSDTGDVDGKDYILFQACMSGPGVPPPPHCLAGGTPPPGSFTLHGRPVDVFADLDGSRHALLYVRARHYDLANGRWLQRDPKGYVDGPNLYEAFKGNPLAHVDPTGEWVAEELAGILAEKGSISVEDVHRLGEKLNSAAKWQVKSLTEAELQLLKVLGGTEYGNAWTEDNLSDWLLDEAREKFDGSPDWIQRRTMGNLATRRRLLYMILMHSTVFCEYVTDLYRVSRDFNPLHFAAERGIQVGTGTETVTGQSVSRVGAAAEFLVYLAVLKGYSSATSAVKNHYGLGQKGSPGANAGRRFETKDPLDSFPYGRHPGSTVLTPDTPPGTYVYVRDPNGVVYIAPDGPHAHPRVLGNAQPATAAGTLTVDSRGVVVMVDNISGTFRFPASSLPSVKRSIEGQGLKVDSRAMKQFEWD